MSKVILSLMFYLVIMLTNIYKKSFKDSAKFDKNISALFYDIYFLKKRTLIKNYHFLPVIKTLNF